MTEQHIIDRGNRERDRQESLNGRVFCCTGMSCRMSGALDVHESLHSSCAKHSNMEVVATGCMGLCSHGPLVRIEVREKSPRLLVKMTVALAADLVEPPPDPPEELRAREFPLNHSFFTSQQKVVTASLDRADPTNLDHYLAVEGYRALADVILRRTPESVCDVITRSGLRGRGGAGYPTGVKWSLVRGAPASRRFVVANGDEGDPGAFMDRTVMEDNPHRLLEGILIAAYAVGAGEAYLYVRGEYPVAVQRFSAALADARREGLAGANILGTDFSCDVQVRIGAGAFVCGEETALMASIEGKRGIPHLRPPYPSEKGIHGFPTLINNVETLANVPTIIRLGSDWHASMGTAESKGTKVFSISGPLVRTGVIEVPLGITLGEIVYDVCGGPIPGRTIKAIQCGGPSGGCIPRDQFHLSVDYESLRSVGAIMGSGGMIALDGDTNMVGFAKFFMDFCRDESCGKCVPCRVGTVQMSRYLERIDNGTGTIEDLEHLEELCDMVQQTSLCGLGQAAPNPVMSALRHFRHEFQAKIKGRRLGKVDISHLILPSSFVGALP